MVSLFHVQSYQRFRDSFPGRVHQDWGERRDQVGVKEGRWAGRGKSQKEQGEGGAGRQGCWEERRWVRGR